MENTTDSGSRLTRSLRKRLTSVDSDNSSRPGSPAPSKLMSVTEISSPSRPTRTTRRNSTSGSATPVKTPAKRGFVTSSSVISENVEAVTPARRNTRRRSASINDNEVIAQQNLKVPSFKALAEENVSSDLKTAKRLTRSHSKSPQVALESPTKLKTPDQNKAIDLQETPVLKSSIQKPRKPGPKCKTQQLEETEDISDVEIIVPESEVDNINTFAPNITTIDLNDIETEQTDKENKSTLKKTESGQEVATEVMDKVPHDIKDVDKEFSNKQENDRVKNESEVGKNQKSYENQLNQLSSKVDDKILKVNANESTSRSNSNEPICSSQNTLDDEVLKILEDSMGSLPDLNIKDDPSPPTQANLTSIILIDDSTNEQNPNMSTQECQENDIAKMDDKKTSFINSSTRKSEVINSLNDSNLNVSSEGEKENLFVCTTPPAKDEICASTCTPYRGTDEVESTATDCITAKKVDFTSSPSSDSSIKNVYPRTPALTKTKSFVVVESSRNENSLHVEEKTMKTLSESRPEQISSDGETHEMSVKSQTIENSQIEMSANSNSNTPSRAFKSGHNLKTVQSSTPINIEATNYKQFSDVEKRSNKSDDPPEAKDNLKKITIEKQMIHPISPKQNENEKDYKELKWVNPSVKGTIVEGSKLDTVLTQSSNEKITVNKEIELKGQIKTKKKISGGRGENGENREEEIVEEEEEEEEEENNEDEYELEDEEIPYILKKSFHDDEAMEVTDYESGDSMDSEERQEIIENQIPVDGESIGSHTTEEEPEEEDSENDDSFIVSDSEEREELESDDEEENNEDVDVDKRKKKKAYKRIQRPTETSSSEEEVNGNPQETPQPHCSLSENGDVRTNNYVNELSRKQKDTHKQLPHQRESSSSSENENKETNEDNIDNLESESKSNTNDQLTEKNILNKSGENAILDSSKLSDSALRLHGTDDRESDEIDEENINISRKEILRKINQSDRFNKSVRDLNPEANTSPVEHKQEFQKKCNNNDDKKLTSTGENAENRSNHSDSVKHIESHLGEVSVTTESDDDKENGQNNKLLLLQRKPNSGLSLSFGNYKESKNISKGLNDEWQRSFTIDVSVKVGNIDAAVTEIKSKKTSSPSSSIDAQEDKLNSEDVRYLENIKHIPLHLGNPLIRTRRQSLALPTNPDMDICSSSHGIVNNKKLKRKSLGVFSNDEFKPSQSFIDSKELRKCDLDRQVAKRKRLSKSFCGASETLDNSIVDIDVRHLHKRSKLIGENSMHESHQDSTENMNTSKLFTKISSTPHEKATVNDSNNNIKRILSRCDEILEAANRAKFEAKTNFKKSKVKLSKKQKKKLLVSSQETNQNDQVLRGVSKEINRKDKTKTAALTQAIKAADAILSKKKQKQNNMGKENTSESKLLSSDVLEAIKESALIIKKNKKETRIESAKAQKCITSTTAGKFLEMPQTPKKKKKKATYINLPTGKVSVEPVSPKKRSVTAGIGFEFRESPVTPLPVGFKVRQISDKPNAASASVLKDGKRKRHYAEPKQIISKPQWTQSGLFIEEEITTIHQMARSDASHIYGSRKAKQRLIEKKEDEIKWNFKENAIMRPDIKRDTNREILRLKKRHVQGIY